MSGVKGPLPVNIGVQPEAQAYVGKPVKMHVYNSGTVTLRVTALPVRLAGGCHATPSSLVHVLGQTTVLIPRDKAHDFYATVSGGKGVYGVLFSGMSVSAHPHQAGFAAAVGSQITTDGHLTCHHHVAPTAAAPTHSAGFPAWGVILGLVIAFTVAVAVTRTYWKRRHSDNGNGLD